MGAAENSNASVRLKEYLQSHRLRKTPERFAILQTACSFNGHFDLNMLKERMEEDSHFVVSLATLYNTIAILVDAGLVIRHRLSGKAEYEVVTISGESHFHLVCTECGKVREMHNDKLHRYMKDMRVARFTVNSYSLYMYGLCSKCANAIRRKKEKMLKTNKRNGKE